MHRRNGGSGRWALIAGCLTGLIVVGPARPAVCGSGRFFDENAAERSEREPAESSERTAEDLKDRIVTLHEGPSSRAARQDAIERLPLEHLSPEHRRRADAVLADVHVFRELPTLLCEIEPDVYRYFIAHPDVAVSIWHAMNISKFQLRPIAPERYSAGDGDGTEGTVEVLYRGGEDTLVLCNGTYNSPLLVRPIETLALMHLQTGFARTPDGRFFARHRMQLFVSFPTSQGAATAAKLVSPLSNLIIDRNFEEITLFLHMMSQVMARQPGWVERLTTRLENVPDTQKDLLLDVAARVYVAAQKRATAAAASEPPQ